MAYEPYQIVILSGNIEDISGREFELRGIHGIERIGDWARDRREMGLQPGNTP
jgi:hypothetical protein